MLDKQTSVDPVSENPEYLNGQNELDNDAEPEPNQSNSKSFDSQEEEKKKGYESITQHVIKVYDRKNKQI